MSEVSGLDYTIEVTRIESAIEAIVFYLNLHSPSHDSSPATAIKQRHVVTPH
jgi:hypothetical protein